MATPYTDIIKKFNDNLPEDVSGNMELSVRRQHLRNGLSSFLANYKTITIDTIRQEVKEDLDDTDMLLLSLWMYDSYLDQEIMRYNKVINISNEFMQMSGASMRVKTLQNMKDSNMWRINNILSNMM